MAGILDKKTRILDYILTKEGRSQLKDGGDLRFVYATVSDRGVEYIDKQRVDELTYADANLSYTTSPLKISDSERFYLGFEATSTHTDRLNPEYSLLGHFSYPKFTTDIVDRSGNNNFETNKSFVEIIADMTGSFSKKIKSLKILDTFNQIDEEKIILDDSESLGNIVFDFANKKLDTYPTIISANLNIDKENTLKDDLRFSHKNNFKKLIPVNKDNSPLFSESVENVTTNNVNFIFKKYEADTNILQDDLREEAIKKAISRLEKDTRIFKKTIDIVNPTENDLWITQIFEHNSGTEIFNKLAAIDLGEVYFEDQGIYKQIFLYGKIYKSTEFFNLSGDDTDTSPVYEKEYILSQEYSFINIFTLVIE